MSLESQERNEKSRAAGKVLKEIMAKNFANWQEMLAYRFKKLSKSQNRINSNKCMPRNFIATFKKAKDKIHLKANGRKYVYYLHRKN